MSHASIAQEIVDRLPAEILQRIGAIKCAGEGRFDAASVRAQVEGFHAEYGEHPET